MERKGEPFKDGDDLVKGFKSLAGRVARGAKVYRQGRRGLDGDPPQYEFKVIDPSLIIDGEKWMLVRYRSGETNQIFREQAESSGLYWIK